MWQGHKRIKPLKRGTFTTKYYRNDRHYCRGGRHDRGYYTLERMPSHDTQIPKQGIKQHRIIPGKYKSSIVLSHAIKRKDSIMADSAAQKEKR